MHHGLVRIQWRPTVHRPAAPLEFIPTHPAGPALGVGDVVLLLPRPRLGAPPRAALVAAALDEGQVRRVRDRRATDPEAADVRAVAGTLVVVGEAVVRCADLAGAAGDRDRLQPGVAPRRPPAGGPRGGGGGVPGRGARPPGPPL